MAANNFLVVGITPANNESNVNINTPIKIKFSQYMRADTINPTNIVFRKTNGDVFDYDIEYDPDTLTATIISAPLEYGTEYQVYIAGGNTALLGITNDYLPESKTYRFRTTYNVSVSPPLNAKAGVDSGFVSLQWERPAQYDLDLPLTYEVMISESNDPANPVVWPGEGDINKTNSLLMNVPKRFSEGNYYAYIRAFDGVSTSQWAIVQFVVQSAVIIPTTPSEPTNGGSTGDTGNTDTGGGDIFSFDVIDNYPRANAVDITPEKILIVFSDNVDASSVTGDTIYLVKKSNKTSLSLIDFMTDYSPAKKVAAVIDPITTPNMVSLSATLEEDSEYTVIVRESVRNTSGSSLGVAYHWAFITKYSQLYGDAQAVRQDIGSLSDSVTDKVLFSYMNESSQYAYQVVSNTPEFLATDYEGGKAPYYVHQYVRLRTAYDLILNSQLKTGSGNMASSNATSQIKLGTLTVQKDTGAIASASANVTDLLSAIKDKMKPYEDMMHGRYNRGYAKAQVVVRGENVETYPDFFTRDEFTDLGQ